MIGQRVVILGVLLASACGKHEPVGIAAGSSVSGKVAAGEPGGEATGSGSASAAGAVDPAAAAKAAALAKQADQALADSVRMDYRRPFLDQPFERNPVREAYLDACKA